MRCLWLLPLFVIGPPLTAQPVTPSPVIGNELRDKASADHGRKGGSSANAAGAAPTFWPMGDGFDLGDLSPSRTSYRRFASSGIGALSGNKLSVATSPAHGPVKVSATYSDFRPVADTRAISARDVRVSLGLAF